MTITDEMVEAVKAAVGAVVAVPHTDDEMDEGIDLDDVLTSYAIAALEAAAPLIRAADAKRIKELEEAEARVADMEEALRPFIAHNSSDEFVTIKVRSADIARARNCITTVSPKTAGGC